MSCMLRESTELWIAGHRVQTPHLHITTLESHLQSLARFLIGVTFLISRSCAD